MSNPRILERKFIRVVQRKGFFLTARGVVNTVQSNGHTLLISTSKNESNIQITRGKIRKAIR